MTKRGLAEIELEWTQFLAGRARKQAGHLHKLLSRSYRALRGITTRLLGDLVIFIMQLFLTQTAIPL